MKRKSTIIRWTAPALLPAALAVFWLLPVSAEAPVEAYGDNANSSEALEVYAASNDAIVVDSEIVVADDDGRPAGVVTARALLRQRAGTALALGDEVSVADDAADLGQVRAGLAGLARGLLDEQVSPNDVAAVISDVMRGLTARATALAGPRIEPPVVFTGGVAMVAGMDKALARAIGHDVAVVPDPQLTGALGAALLAARQCNAAADGRGPTSGI